MGSESWFGAPAWPKRGRPPTMPLTRSAKARPKSQIFRRSCLYPLTRHSGWRRRRDEDRFADRRSRPHCCRCAPIAGGPGNPDVVGMPWADWRPDRGQATGSEESGPHGEGAATCTRALPVRGTATGATRTEGVPCRCRRCSGVSHCRRARTPAVARELWHPQMETILWSRALSY